MIDDYAHHPTAVRETLSALHFKFHGSRLFLLFEPGSASSKRRIFEKRYIEAFQRAEIVYIYKPYKVGGLKSRETFNNKKIVSVLRKRGMNAKAFDKIDDLLRNLKKDVVSGDIVVIMSCRGFDGLREKIFGYL